MAPISSLQNPTVKLIRSLAEKKYRQETGLFVAEGERALDRARRQGREPEYLVGIEAPAAWGGARTLHASPEVMASLSAQANPPARIGVFRQTWSNEALPNGLWIVLEDMRDPGNLGTIIRTADAVAAAGIVLAGQSCDPFGPDCVRATMGSIFAVPLVRKTTREAMGLCRSWPGDVVATHLRAEASYRRTYAAPVLLVMGSEGRGLSDDLTAACSIEVRIPMPGGAESLNVAVATAVMLYEIAKP